MNVNLTIQSGDLLAYIAIGILGVIIYSSRTFFDMLMRRITCFFFGHDEEKKTIANIDYLQCKRCYQISHNWTRYKEKEKEVKPKLHDL